MALSPFRGFYDMQGEMNRMFDEVFGNLARTGGRQQGDQPTQWAPALDVLQEDGDIVVRAELPGVRQEDVDITFHNGVLTISGVRKAEEEKEGAGYYVRERRYGSFRRSMTVPEGRRLPSCPPRDRRSAPGCSWSCGTGSARPGGSRCRGR